MRHHEKLIVAGLLGIKVKRIEAWRVVSTVPF